MAVVQPLNTNDHQDHHAMEPAPMAAMPYAGIHEPAPANAGVVSINAPSTAPGNGQFIPENWHSDPIDDALAKWEVPTPEFNQQFDQPVTPQTNTPGPNVNPADYGRPAAAANIEPNAPAPTAPDEIDYNPTEQSALAMFSDIISNLSRPERDAVLARANGSPEALFKELYNKHFN
jgi:hypothetical protein